MAAAACVCQVSSVWGRVWGRHHTPPPVNWIIGAALCSTSVIISGEVPSCCFDRQTSMVVVCLLCQSGRCGAAASKIWPIGAAVAPPLRQRLATQIRWNRMKVRVLAAIGLVSGWRVACSHQNRKLSQWINEGSPPDERIPGRRTNDWPHWSRHDWLHLHAALLIASIGQLE